MKGIIITIGDELLIGQVVDTNSAWMGNQLNLVGVEIVEKISIKDGHQEIMDALENASHRVDLVLLTGGLGPTKDDVTKKAIADYLQVGMQFHNPTWERIARLFQKWGRSTTEEHRMQCFMPQGITLLPNKMGTAPGMQFESNGATIVSMPGIPYEMKYIMENSVLPMLKANGNQKVIYHRTIRTIGEGESRIAKKISGVIEEIPPHIKVAFLPSLGQVRIRLSGTGLDEDQLQHEVDRFVEIISSQLSSFVFGYDKDTIEQVIGSLLREKGMKLGLAESCTGGSIASRITSIPGSSDYFEGCIVSYSNSVKQEILGVSEHTLHSYGAVSEETVVEMAHGAKKMLNCDIAFSISGIAGPGGGTEEKPVGTIWMACTDGINTGTLLIKAGKDREKNIEYSGTYGLNLIRKFITAQ